MHSYLPELMAQFFAVAVSIYSLRKRAVSLSGFFSMLLIASFFIWKEGIALLIVLFAMFASASLLTKYKHSYKSALTSAVLKKQGPRDVVQALSNLGTSFLCFVIYSYTQQEVYLLALLCSVAASNADSWASEIGVLSKRKPVMITNLKTCKPGISGGVTWMGTLAGIGGSIFIAVLSLFLKQRIGIELSNGHLFLLISFSGILGLFLDSFLGATLQIIYVDPQGEETEKLVTSAERSRGISWINNDLVNFLSSLTIALIVLVLYFK